MCFQLNGLQEIMALIGCEGRLRRQVAKAGCVDLEVMCEKKLKQPKEHTKSMVLL